MRTTLTETNLKAEIAKDLVAQQAMPASGVFACALPALLLATVCLLPYLNKPFLIDDPHFLTMAQQIVKHPTHPMDFNICWNTIEDCTKAYNLTPGNALMGYVLVPTVITGAHEWVAHLTQLVLVWIAVVAMTSLTLRFGWDRKYAIAGALLLVAIPPFLPMASTAMPDILATALALVAVERLAAWKAEQKWSQGLVAALALGLAGYARSHLALLLPLAAFFLLDSVHPREILGQVRRRPWLWIPVAVGTGLLLAIIVSVREHNLAINPPPVVLIQRRMLNNLYAYLLYFAFPIPLAACWLANRLKVGRLWTVSMVLAVAITPWLLGWASSLILFLVVLGLSALASLFFEAARRGDQMGLFLMLWVLIPLPIIYYSHLPMKYLLPCMPAVILLCLRLLDGVSVPFARAAASVLIVASTCYSLLILHSDAEFASIGRDAMYRLVAPHVAAGERVWYPGQYWSFWYAPLAGATLTFAGGPQPKPGDLLVVDVYAAGDHSPLNRFPHRTLVETITYKYRFGRTMGAGKGLYANGSGYWLWGFGESDKDRFELWRID
jgi:hypothetical protein